MPTRHRPASAPRRATQAAVLALAALLALSACSSAESKEPLTTGIPATWAAGIDDGHERYPSMGSTGRGDMHWDCPLVESVEVDDEKLTDLGTTFWELDEGVYEIECDFYESTSVHLRFAQADDDTAFAALVESTNAYEQIGNEQVQDAVTVGERDYVLVTWTFPTNPGATPNFVACYLDETTLSRACLDLSGAEEDGFGAEEAAALLSEVLSS